MFEMSGNEAQQLDLAWRKAAASNQNGACVELASLPNGGGVAMRHSKNPAGPALVYSRAEVAAFLDGARKGEFDDLIAG